MVWRLYSSYQSFTTPHPTSLGHEFTGALHHPYPATRQPTDSACTHSQRTRCRRGQQAHAAARRQALVTGPENCLILNPGSVGCPAFADVPAAANFEHRSPHARYAILTQRQGKWSADLIALDYDWDRAAQHAAKLGFPKWATMLATGATP